jgi:ribosomal protein S18 acetylase RimI-like enzyme
LVAKSIIGIVVPLLENAPIRPSSRAADGKSVPNYLFTFCPFGIILSRRLGAFKPLEKKAVIPAKAGIHDRYWAPSFRRGDEEKLVPESTLTIRDARPDDVPAVVRLDERITGIAKPAYWRDIFEGRGQREAGVFLVAEHDGRMAGFIIGEVRAWEFGSPPCGWIFAIGVDPEGRLGGVGTQLFQSICERFRKAGVPTVRTMLARDDTVIMSFFRSQGMTGGPFIELEARLDDL